jgi:DNA-binding NarL/FixJ family response regulator
VSAIRKIAAGGVHISEAAAAQLVAAQGGAPAGDAAPHTRLSNREFEVFRLLVEGNGPTGIADRLHLSVKTVSTHKTRILDKMAMESVADLVRYAVEKKLS